MESYTIRTDVQEYALEEGYPAELTPEQAAAFIADYMTDYFWHNQNEIAEQRTRLTAYAIEMAAAIINETITEEIANNAAEITEAFFVKRIDNAD